MWLPKRIQARRETNVSLETITSTRASGRPASNKQISSNDRCTSVKFTLKNKVLWYYLKYDNVLIEARKLNYTRWQFIVQKRLQSTRVRKRVQNARCFFVIYKQMVFGIVKLRYFSKMKKNVFLRFHQNVPTILS